MKHETIIAMQQLITDIANMKPEELFKSSESVISRASFLKKQMGNESYEEVKEPPTVSEILNSLRKLGYHPRWNPSQKSVTFYYFGNKCTFFPRKGYFNGKGLHPGYGLDYLIEQLSDNPQPICKYEKDNV